jgi:hypothetical protein
MGFDNPICPQSQWSFTGELGILFQGKAKAGFKNSEKNPPDLNHLVRREARKAGDKFLLMYYPFISVGIKFNV